MFILGWILWGSEVTHETMDPASGLGSHRTMTLSTPCTYMKRQKTLEGLVLFGCQLGFRVHISRPLTCPSCTQIGQVLLVFFLALRWLPSPLIYQFAQIPQPWSSIDQFDQIALPWSSVDHQFNLIDLIINLTNLKLKHLRLCLLNLNHPALHPSP